MADKIVQLKDKNNNNLYPVHAPVIELTDTDPGEGAPLDPNKCIGVYGDMDWLFDVFYPVGSYYETSDASFDPNTAWGGTWVEDAKGRVTVSKTDSGTFSTISATGGLEQTNHVYYRAPINTSNAQNANEAYSGYVNARVNSWLTAGGGSNLALDMVVASVAGNASNDGAVRNPTEAGHFRYTSTNLQPYVVVKRWHRIG